MRSYKLASLYGFLVWLIPFITAFLIFGFRTSNRALFESIMTVILTLSVVFFSVFYFRKVKTDFFKEGLLLGVIWFAINIIIDLIMLMPETPMQMSFTDYMGDIGLTYAIIPIICIGLGYALEKRNK